MATGVGFGGGAPIKQEPTSNEEPNYVLDRPGPPVQKTPISFLQEMCTRKNIKPEYELLSTEGQVHEPTFVYRVTVQDLSEVGQGKSKKFAKHFAARSILERIISVGRYKDFGMGNTVDEANETIRQLADAGASGGGPSRLSGGDENAPAAAMSSAVSVTSDDGDGPGNPVGRLQEYCQKLKSEVPQYNLVREEGPPHERMFVIQVTLRKYTAEGSGRNKKQAKREAAEKLFKILEAIPAAQQESLGVAEDDELAETGGLQSMVQQPSDELHEDLAYMSLNDHVITVPVDDAEKSALKILADLDLEKEREKIGYRHVELLDMIGRDENWETNYYPLPRRSKIGDYQCMVQLNAMPVAVCYGRGPTLDDAQQAAAFNALEYLKIATKE